MGFRFFYIDKFENDGNALWEKKTVSTVCVDNNTKSTCKTQQSPITTIVEHNSAKSSLNWRKHIGHLFHVIKLRSGSSTSSCHVSSSSKVEGTKGKKQGWMVRTLTKRKSKKSKSWLFSRFILNYTRTKYFSIILFWFGCFFNDWCFCLKEYVEVFCVVVSNDTTWIRIDGSIHVVY